MIWLDKLFIPISLTYFLVVMALFVYGLNFLYLSWAAYQQQKSFKNKPLPPLIDLPFVTVQLPIYNERFVANRLIEAAVALDYPSDLLEIQVLDDSTDDTVSIIAETVDRLKAKGANVLHLHRDHRNGYKAGALRDGLAQAHGKFIAIFDADFLVPPSFLKKALPYFENDHVGFVQARWGHLNREYSFFTYLQSLSIDAHFVVEQFARASLGFWFNFNGTAGIWRKAAILDAGGWKAETLTEDLDLSYRVFLRGWEARYVNDLVVPAELPVTFAAYRNQQHRWARGSLECAIRFIPIVWTSDAPLKRKLQASLHLTGYAVHLLLFFLTLLYPFVLLLSVHYPTLISLFGIAIFLNFTGLAPTIFFAVAQHNLGRNWLTRLPAIIGMTVLGAGMMVNTLRAGIQIFIQHHPSFERTPKFGITGKKQGWDTSRYRIKVDKLVWLELALAIFNFWTLSLAFQSQNWLILIYTALFTIGLISASGATLFQAIAARTSLRLESSYGLGNSVSNELVKCNVPPYGISIERAILETLVYSDIFDYPLNTYEIYRYLPSIKASFTEVSECLREISLNKNLMEQKSDFYILRGREDIVDKRRARAKAASRLWPKAIKYGKFIASMPFVRMVAVTGSLAANNLDKGNDIDYLIVTTPGHLWTCRALSVLIVYLARIMGINLCPNYLLTENALELTDHSMYVAHELAQMIPLSGMEYYNRMRSLNNWSQEFLPNAAGLPEGRSYEKESRIIAYFKKFLENILGYFPIQWIENWEMARKIKKLRVEQNNGPEINYSADVCKGHLNNHRLKTEVALNKRLNDLELF